MKEKTLSPKVKALYEAVEELIFENIDVKGIKVSDITERAGIGKGTAYEYFESSSLADAGFLRDLGNFHFPDFSALQQKFHHCFVQRLHLR